MKRIFGILLIASLLSGCKNADLNSFTILSPSGAPACALYKLVDQDIVETATAATIPAHFLRADKDIIIFESLKGLQAIKNNNANYKFWFNVTGGNVFLIGLNKENGVLPTKEDNVVSFMKDSLPDLAFKKMYGDVVDTYLDDNSGCAAILKNGTYNGSKVDFLVIAEPVLTKILKTNPTYLNKYSEINLSKEYGNRFNVDPVIPQAAVFVNYERYLEKTNDFNALKNVIYENMDSSYSHPEEIVETMNKYDIATQTNKFGFTSSDIYDVQKDLRNGLGIIPKKYANFNILEFMNNVGVSIDFREYIL